MIAITNATSMYPDSYFTRSRLRNLSLHDFKVTAGLGNLRYSHFFHDIASMLARVQATCHPDWMPVRRARYFCIFFSFSQQRLSPGRKTVCLGFSGTQAELNQGVRRRNQRALQFAIVRVPAFGNGA